MTRMTALHPASFSPYFASSSIRVMIFLRDDMLEQVVRSAEGFTALTHVTARQADTLRWTEDQILVMVVKRFFANQEFADYLEISRDRTEANASYRKSAFGKIFPPTVFRGSRQSPTIRWICNRCADGRGVVTPRDVLDLSIREATTARPICRRSRRYIGPRHWRSRNSIRVRGTVKTQTRDLSRSRISASLEGHRKVPGGKTDYNSAALQILLGSEWKAIVEHLLAIGFFSRGKKLGEEVFSIPSIYRHGMNLTQGKA